MYKTTIKQMLEKLATEITTDVEVPEMDMQYQDSYRCGAYMSRLEIIKREIKWIAKNV